MRVLVVGSGGREHALVRALARSERVTELIAHPGREGFHPTARGARPAGEGPLDLLELATKEKVDLTVVGPEAPLVAGIADRFAGAGRPLFGPSEAAARLEGSKVFCKEVLLEAGVPTARHVVVRRSGEVADAVDLLGLPLAVKADGLAAGKGVVVAQRGEEAAHAARQFIEEKVLGEAGETLLFEEFLRGEELSVLALVRDEDFHLFPASRDYKRIGDGGTGPNTGGMGAITPVPGVGEELLDQIRREVFRPVLRVMKERGAPYRGILYAGIMLTDEGPKVLEFNCRFGDPETQAVLERVDEDLALRFDAVARGEWIDRPLKVRPEVAVCIVLAAGGYPGKPKTGVPIEGLDTSPPAGVVRFHAGTAKSEGRWVTAGGRVLNVVARGESIEAALEAAYADAERIGFEGKQIRRDIGGPGVQG